ncbi:MAG: hypothetical protein J0G96_03310 [Flavobacteriia bacterium]|nr:hypothetical protein [Flavobacteriia bacterium]OJX38540.1 MAG: hypothetical protein BGO87_10520 [Flavobacteriia bacterium 40-80]
MEKNLKTQTNKTAVTEQHSAPQEQFGYLKPYGKVLGNDVFTFHRPNTEELLNTLRSFPEPVYWFTSAGYLYVPAMQGFIAENKQRMYVFSEEPVSGFKDILNVKMEELENRLKMISAQNAMILISCNTEDEERYDELIGELIKRLKQQ